VLDLPGDNMSAITMDNRWWIYQRERFPLFAHGLLIAAFSISAVCVSALLRGEHRWPTTERTLTAFAVSFLFFALLRIADEFKDAEEDARWRPYRPVPRGLVTLRELARIGAAIVLVQAAVSFLLEPLLVLVVAAAWAYFALMVREFFAAAWLKARPLPYMISHMMILPLITLCATACDWLTAAPRAIPSGLGWFLLTSFGNGFVLEIGRKIRAPQDEEPGVVTYSAAWGRNKAVAAWLAAVAFTAVCALITGLWLGTGKFLAIGCGTLFGAALIIAWHFLRTSAPASGKWFEHASGIWMLSLYMGLGVVPLALRAAGLGQGN
jgi:4-hydroxybenzoate polyprenyltransferase